MLQTETTINELDQYLEHSGLYYSNEDKGQVLSDEVRSAWRNRFVDALKNDFLNYCQLQVTVSDDYFELFGDQGATVWVNKIVVEDNSAIVKLSFHFKAVINYRRNRLALTEHCLRLQTYPGSNVMIQGLFRKLKAAHVDGFEPSTTIRMLLDKSPGDM